MGLLDSIKRILSPLGHSEERVAPTPQKLGLALGSGSVRGWAHIGVLKVLEEEGIVPDVVTGTSMGAIIGAAWCGGMSAAELEEFVLGFDLKQAMHVMGNPNPLQPGLVRGDGLADFLRPYLKSTFEELEIPFACVSCDMRTGERIVSSSGDLLSALQGSFSIPVLFEPVDDGEMLLADGGMVEPVPVFVAREMGATHIVGVSLSMVYPHDVLEVGVRWPHRPGLLSGKLQFAIASTEVMGFALTNFAEAEAELMIKPNTRDFGQFSFEAARGLVDAGEAAAREHLEELRGLHASTR